MSFFSRNNIQQFIHWIVNLGVTDGLGYNEKKKTQLLNATLAFCLPINIFFSTLNFIQGKGMLGIINFCLLLGGLLILVINYYQRFFLARLVLTFLASVFFGAAAILYRNGGEFYLLANLMIIIIYFDNTRYLILISLFNCALFLAIRYWLEKSGFIYGTVPFGRVMFNMGLTLVMMVVALIYFKRQQVSYQRQIEEKNKELEQLNQNKQKLFSIIAHDLRSPIGQLKSSLDLVKKAYLQPEEFIKISGDLSLQVDQLHSTLDNLLRWSISQFQGIQAAPAPTDLNEIIEQNKTLFREAMALKKITLKADPLIPLIWADPDHCRLILRNLISNAIKYSYESGYIYIRSKADDSMLTLSITDNGTGIPMEKQADIFTDSAMISSAGTSMEKGTGLGLKLCKEFVEKNNGQIWLVSDDKGGSTFSFTLPLYKA
jgi:two-component system sensor histidine kinase/response regulator